jgi:hypothetical protein
LLLKTIRPTVASHRIASSVAFFISPALRFANVTVRWRSLVIRAISIFLRPMIGEGCCFGDLSSTRSRVTHDGRAGRAIDSLESALAF